MNRTDRSTVTAEVAISDPSQWVEGAIRAWEAQAHEDGWDQPNRFGLLLRYPGGLGLAQIHIPAQALALPHILFPELARKSTRYVREAVGERHFAGQGMRVIGAAMCSEAYASAHPLNAGLFAGASTLAGRIEVRRVIMVAPREADDVMLLRRRGALTPPELSEGIPPEAAPGGRPDHAVRDAIRAIVHKLCHPGLLPPSTTA